MVSNGRRRFEVLGISGSNLLFTIMLPGVGLCHVYSDRQSWGNVGSQAAHLVSVLTFGIPC